MSCEGAEVVSEVRVDAKRSFDNEPIQFDWHDYVAKTWRPGAYFNVGECIRFKRNDPRSPGLQARCSQAGATGGRPPVWSRAISDVVDDGSAQWTMEALTAASVNTIATSEFPALADVTFSQETSNDFVYTVFVAGGVSGQDYPVKHRVTLTGAASQAKEMVAILPVRD